MLIKRSKNFGKIAFVCCLCKMAEIRPTICNLVYDMTPTPRWPRFGLLSAIWSVDYNFAYKMPTIWQMAVDFRYGIASKGLSIYGLYDMTPGVRPTL